MNSQIVKFEGKDLEMLIVNGQRAFSSETVGLALEYAQPRDAINKIFERNNDEFEEGIDYLRHQLDLAGQRRKITVFFQTGVNLIGMFSDQPLAKSFRRWAKHVLAGVQALQEQQASVAESTINIPISEYIHLLKSRIEFLENRARAFDQPQVKVRQAKSTRYLSYRPVTPEDEKIVMLLVEQGMSKLDIARRLGRCRAVINRIFNTAKDKQEAVN